MQDQIGDYRASWSNYRAISNGGDALIFKAENIAEAVKHANKYFNLAEIISIEEM